MSRHSKATGFQPVRHDRLIQEQRHDTYKLQGKLHEPTVCSGCGAVFHAGRWQWLARPAQAHEGKCPACHRISDDFPAGFIHLTGDFLAGHESEIRHLVDHTAEAESADHPLEQLMAIRPENGGLLLTTTGIHLARRLGEALHHAYQGSLDFHYNEDDMLLRVFWSR